MFLIGNNNTFLSRYLIETVASKRSILQFHTCYERLEKTMKM